MKNGFALAILLAMSVQTGMANDIEKVMNKALGSGKGQLLKQAGGIGSKFLKSSQSPAIPAPGAAAATPAANASPIPVQQPATGATPAATAAAARPGAVSSTTATAASAAASEHPLRDKLMHRAAVESEKYARKYGDKYLKQGKGQLGKLLN